MQKTFYSNGKLLLSGEYAILDGALGLAIPTQYGQSLSVAPTTTGFLQWTSFDQNNAVWFQAQMALDNLALRSTSNKAIAQTLTTLLREAQAQNPNFLSHPQGVAVTTHLNFSRFWGLGTSSTLINNIAQWAGVDAYQLLWKAFGGSGYDIACAQHPHPITYQLANGLPQIAEVPFDPPFKDQLCLVYRNQKQRSQAAIAAYRKRPPDQNNTWLSHVSALTQQLIAAPSLPEFEALLAQHEALLSKVLGQPPVKAEHFPDYPGALKSLGAWGGDFILATRTQEAHAYFTAKGFTTLVPYTRMAL